jgi:uncharacterized membrane protein YfcA
VTLSFAQFAFLLPLGVLFSAVGTVVGLGGGIFVVPLLVLAFGIPLKAAIAVATFCIVPACLLSTVFNAWRRQIDYFSGIALELPALAGAIVGTLLVTHIPVRPMEFVFASVVALLAFTLLAGKSTAAESGWLDRITRVPPVIARTHAGYSYRVGIPGITLVGLVAGIFAGLFGMGGGVFKTPVMVRMFNMPARIAAATTLFAILFTSIAASVSHWQQGRMDWSLALPLAGAFLLGAAIGNQFTGKLEARTIEKTLGAILGVFAVAIVGHASFIAG